MQDVLSNYAEKLAEVDGRLYLTGIGQHVRDQIVGAGKLRLNGPVQVYEATPIRGQSTQDAVTNAQTWLVDAGPKSERGGGS